MWHVAADRGLVLAPVETIATHGVTFVCKSFSAGFRMSRAPVFGHVQMKAIFFLLLLAGHDCVRVTEEVQWSKSKWAQLHADCKYSFTEGCAGEGCVRKRLPLDLTPSVSCRHTDAYLLKHNGLKNFQTIVKHLEEKSDKYAKSCQQASWLHLERC